jgi:FkbH-like protein
MLVAEQIQKAKAEKKSIKCVVWDLDNTIWDGVLLEDPNVTLRPGVVETLRELDRRGILHSIASKNDHEAAMKKLQEFGIQDYFLYPEINWNSKSSSIQAIAKSINIGLDTLAFIDDQPFEREEVAYELPDVMCVDALDLAWLPEMPGMMPRFVTNESRLRRQMYLGDIARKVVESEFTGPNEDFLATLEMVFTIKPASEADLQRAEELTVRTHQLNTTGYTYSYDELNAFRHSPNHLLLVSSLEDKYGTYGTIGLALVEKGPAFWSVKLLLMSCRVMSRGVGTIMMSTIMQRAREAGACLRADFIPNGRNRMMYVTYKFGGFSEIAQDGDLIIFENDLSHIQPLPEYVQVNIIK